MARYRFSDFMLSPRRRMLVRAGREQPLIPRYFDLLVFLIERRHEAVHRRDIFDNVWKDVLVSDSALSQAIRTIRRTLGDDSRVMGIASSAPTCSRRMTTARGQRKKSLPRR
jgi:DNA-binding winged helix-turn-helix (wHTH) protein